MRKELYIKSRISKIAAVIAILITGAFLVFSLSACNDNGPTGAKADEKNQQVLADDMANNQPTPTDIEYSLERYNLIRRAYWVNGEREKALSLPCPIVKPLGYIYLISMGTVIGQFTVDGKVTSLAKYLTPDYRVVTSSTYGNYSLENADVDGCYGNEVDGIFFFTPDGKYIQWSGDYVYSDIPFNVNETVLN